MWAVRCVKADFVLLLALVNQGLEFAKHGLWPRVFPGSPRGPQRPQFFFYACPDHEFLKTLLDVFHKSELGVFLKAEVRVEGVR